MNDNHNIDNLLKEAFKGFNPEPPPDVWQHIQNRLPQNPVNTPQQNISGQVDVVSKVVQSVKSLSITTKIISGVVAITTAATITYFSFETNQQQTEVNQHTEINLNQATEFNSENATEQLNQVETYNDKYKENKNSEKTGSSAIQPKQANQEADLVQELTADNQIVVNTDIYQDLTKPEETVSINLTQQSNEQKTEDKAIQSVNNDDNIIADEETGNNLLQQEDELFIPSVFTPNGDGKNDFFVIKLPSTDYYHLVVFNPNFEVVFETNNRDHKWDGKHFKSGMDCATGSYQYVIQYKLIGSNQKESKTGFIKLMR